MKDIGAIIFDMDGVLFDTEPLHARAWLVMAQERGLDYDEAFFLEWIGIPDRDLAVHLHAQHPDEDAEALLAAKVGALHDILRRELVPFPGLCEELAALQGTVPMAVATSSRRADLTFMLEHTGMKTFFAATSCYDDVTDHKPHPAPYPLAAERLGVAPADCIALEDSPSGVQAAKAAGMEALAILTSFAADALAGADSFYPTTVEALQALKRRKEHLL